MFYNLLQLVEENMNFRSLRRKKMITNHFLLNINTYLRTSYLVSQIEMQEKYLHKNTLYIELQCLIG